MTSITLKQITAAIRATLVADSRVTDVLETVQDAGAGELTDAISNTPLLQIYVSAGVPDYRSEVAKLTMGSSGKRAIKLAQVTVNLDLYAIQRNLLQQDMPILMDCIDGIYNVLDDQTQTPFFGLDGIQEIQWRWEYRLQKGDQLTFPGATFTLTLWVY